MRIVCWNLRGGTDRKWDLLTGLAPDVAVLSEVAQAPRRLSASLLDRPPEWHWVGRHPAKGLAVATFGGGPSGTLLPDASGRWSVGARHGRLIALGIWSCPQDGDYAREVMRAVDAHERWLDPDADLIVAGDFNVDAAGALRRRSGLFERLRRHLARHGLASAYHAARGEPFGAETAPTYYHHRNRARPFHIDFCFLSPSLLERVCDVQVGHYEDWVEPGHSDHVPVVIDLRS